MKRTLLSCLLLLLYTIAAEATHLKGGYLSFTRDTSPTPNPLKFFFTLTIFTDRTSAVEGPTIEIHHGDGTTSTVPLGDAVSIGHNTDKHTHTWEHTYPAAGTYMVMWSGINRNKVLNTTATSAQYSMLIYSTITINPFNPNASGPVFTLPSFAEAYVGQPFKYNLLAYDTDGDSLSYSLSTPAGREANGNTFYLPGYSIPSGLTINQFGEINWPNPTISGEYALTVMVKEYRNNRLLSTTINEVQLRVRSGPQNSDFTLLNRDRLVTSSAGYILAQPDVPLKLTYFVQHPAAGAPQVAAPVSELLAPHLAGQHSFTATQRDSAGGIVQEFVFVPSSALKRAWPYALGVRGALGANATNPDSYNDAYVYLRVGEQKSASAPDLLPRQQLLLYPNPVRNNFTIEAPVTAPSLFKLYGAEGRIVWQAHLVPGINTVERPAGLASGLYTYLLYNSQGSVTKRGKLVLQ